MLCEIYMCEATIKWLSDFVVAKPASKSNGKSNSTKENKPVSESKPSRDKQQHREQNNKAKDKIDVRKEETKKRSNVLIN